MRTHHLFGRLRRSAKGPDHTKRRSRRPILEILEDRTMPSILFGNSQSLTTSDNNGPVLANAQVRLIFWGFGWDTPSQAAVRTALVNSINALDTSTYFYSTSPGWDLVQYRPGSQSRPTVVDNLHTTYNSPGLTFTANDVSNMLNHEYGMDTSRYYYVIPDANSTPTGCGCSAEHTYWSSGSNHERFGFSRNLATPSLDDLTLLYSHEMVESITDPEGTALQVNPRNPSAWNEISDGEAQSYAFRVVNGAQRVWAQSYYSLHDHRFTIPTGHSQDLFVSPSGVLTINGDQLASHDDNITIDVSGGGILVNLNGEVDQFDPGQISSVVINSGNGNNVTNILRTIVPVSVVGGGSLDTVNIGTGGSVQGISATVNISNPPAGGYTTVNIDDSADGGTHSNIVVTSGSVTGLAPATISYAQGDLRNLNISTGTGSNTVNVLSTPFNFTQAPHTALIGHSGSTTVNVGNAGSLAGIQGAVDVSNPPIGGYTTLTIDDSADGATHSNVVVTSGSVTGLAPATISYQQSDLAALNIDTGTGSNTVNVQSTPNNGVRNPHTALIGHSGSTTVNVGNAGTLAGIQGAVDVSNPPIGGYTTLTIDDSADSATHSNVVVTSGSVTGLAPATISYQQSDLAALNIDTGTGSNTVNVQSTPNNGVQNPHTALIGHSGSTAVNVGNGGTLAGIQGALDVSNPPVGGYTTLTIDDSADAATYPNVVVTSGSVTGLAPATISYQQSDLAALNINMGTGSNTVNVQSSPNNGVRNPQTTLTIGPSNTVNLASPTNTLDPISRVTINDPSSTGTVNLNDSGFAGAEDYSMTASTVAISRSSSFALTYNGSAALNLTAGPGANIFDIGSSSAATTINAGGGGNCFHIGGLLGGGGTQYLATSILGPLTLNGGGADFLDFFDANDLGPETFNFDAVPSTLNLGSTGTTIATFSGMGGGIYVVTNGFSTANDLSGTVIFDQPGGPPCGPGPGRRPPIQFETVHSPVNVPKHDMSPTSVPAARAHVSTLRAMKVLDQPALVDEVFAQIG